MVRQLADEGMTVLLVEHRVEDVLKIRPEQVIFMSEGEIRYNGGADDIDETIDYRQVKLPAPMIMRCAKAEPRQSYYSPAPVSNEKKKPLVSFENVSFFYEANKPVIKDISLDIYPGDRIAVLGHNGAGKTTLVKHAIGLLKPKLGRVVVEGKDTQNMSVAEIAQTMGYVFQSPSHMLFAPSVQEELEFGPKNLGHTQEQIIKEVKEAIDIVNLTGLENSPSLALSFGQQKRVSIAAVLAMQSKILVMDEPTAGQDYRNYIEFMDAISMLNNFSAVLFITHDIDLAVIYANRVLIVNDGRLVCDGSPHDFLKDFSYLRENRLVPTTLLETNLEYYPKTGKFMRAEALAHVA
jgi:energy-coupling factor transport system ATP-binding protein